jgi:hypothetical protein
MWQAVWEHKVTGVRFKEYSHDLYDLERELTKLKDSGHKVVNGPYPI